MSIGLALIGAGIFIKEEHMPAVAACSSLQLKAVYSRSLKSCQALNAGVDIYSDDSGVGKTYHDLLLRDDIHAVLVALPILKQPEFIEAALVAGKHVLSEKPIAGDLHAAQRLVKFYGSNKVKNGATWAVAENFRFIDSFLYARQEIEKLGGIIGFNVRAYSHMKAGSKYFETTWRKTPEYQGGFVLDGGVHTVAGARLLLGSDAKPTTISAFTAAVKKHLPPVDTVNAIWRTETGVSGTFAICHGSSMSSSEYTVVCQDGSVSVLRGKVIVRQGEEKEGNSTEKTFPDEGSGVSQEVAAWAQSILDKKTHPRQSPEQGLADLEVLEKMLKSGEAHGAPGSLSLQV